MLDLIRFTLANYMPVNKSPTILVDSFGNLSLCHSRNFAVKKKSTFKQESIDSMTDVVVFVVFAIIFHLEY